MPPSRSSRQDRKSTRLNSSHSSSSYAVFCLKKKSERVLNRQDRIEGAPGEEHLGHPFAIVETQTISAAAAELRGSDVERYCNVRFVCECCADHRDLHSFPTRRSSD